MCHREGYCGMACAPYFLVAKDSASIFGLFEKAFEAHGMPIAGHRIIKSLSGSTRREQEEITDQFAPPALYTLGRAAAYKAPLSLLY